MSHQRVQDLAGERRDGAVLEVAEDREQLAQARLALRRDHPELGQVTAQSIDRRRALADQLVAHPVQHQHRLLPFALDRREPHARPLHPRLAPAADSVVGAELRAQQASASAASCLLVLR
jgi:hypothetical protein